MYNSQKAKQKILNKISKIVDMCIKKNIDNGLRIKELYFVVNDKNFELDEQQYKKLLSKLKTLKTFVKNNPIVMTDKSHNELENIFSSINIILKVNNFEERSKEEIIYINRLISNCERENIVIGLHLGTITNEKLKQKELKIIEANKQKIEELKSYVNTLSIVVGEDKLEKPKIDNEIKTGKDIFI